MGQSRLLLLNDDPVFKDRVINILDALRQVETRVVRSISEAVAVLMEEHFDGFVIDGEPKAAMEAAAAGRQHFPSLKILCVPRHRPELEQAREAQRHQIMLVNGARGAKRLRKEVRRFLDSLDHQAMVSAEGIDPCHSLIGNLNQFSAAEILQMACLSERTGRFTFKSGRGNSEIYLHHGAIRHAIYGTVEGEPALAEVFRWRQGRFYFEEAILSQVQTVDRPWAHLLIENLQKVDETLSLAAMASS